MFQKCLSEINRDKSAPQKRKVERGPRTASPWMRLEAEIGPVTVSQTKAYFEPEV